MSVSSAGWKIYTSWPVERVVSLAELHSRKFERKEVERFRYPKRCRNKTKQFLWKNVKKENFWMNPEVNSHRKVHHIFLIKRWFKLRCIVLETFLVCQFLSWTQVTTLFDVSSTLKWIVYKDTPVMCFWGICLS